MAKILFPTDFSKVAVNAFLYALHFAKKMNLSIKVISVQSNLNNKLDDLKTEFEKHLKKLTELAEKNNLQDIVLESAVESGDLLHSVLDIIDKEDIAYIVMGTNGENSFDKKIFGSNTINIINNSSVPVFAIPSGIKYKEDSQLAYATLFSKKEDKALQKMLDISSLFEKNLKIVHIENKLFTQDMVSVKEEWENLHSNVDITMKNNEDVETGLIDFCYANKVDILGVFHRESNFFKRLFMNDHSSNLINFGDIAILVF